MEDMCHVSRTRFRFQQAPIGIYERYERAWNPLYRVMEKGEIVFRRSPKILVTLPILNRKESVRETKISLREVRGRGHNFCKVSLHYKFEKRQYFDEYE